MIAMNTMRRLGAVLALAGAAALAHAQGGNAIESVSASRQGTNVIVKIALDHAPDMAPAGFATSNPPRIALDFARTGNATGKTAQDIGIGDLRSVNVVQAGDRSRLVFNLARPLHYATAVDGRNVLLTIEGSGGVATALDAQGMPAVAAAPAPVSAPVPAPAPTPATARASGKPALRAVDFRRGSGGEGRIVVDLPNNAVAVDVKQNPKGVSIDFLKTGLPEALRRRLDVTDFGTPVTRVTAAPQGDGVRLQVEATGLWEHNVYQSDTQLVVEVRPVKEDPNRLVQGTQGYRGEKVSFNFQNIEVRQALQAVADMSGLNIVSSDSVAGSLTLHLKEVPWDQALDVILQAKGLDMRKNGNVIWIAPKEELLTKEKLELEQRAQIAELEPLKSEIFQLNYQKAESFKLVFGLDGASDAKNRILSRRGSAIIEPRTNQLFVTDIPSRLDEVRKLLAKTDIASKQVLIEARIVEANDGFTRNLGAKLGFADFKGTAGGNHALVSGNMNSIGKLTGQVETTDAANDFGNSQFINLPAAPINGVAAGSLAVSLFNSAANRFLNLELSALEADGTGKIISSPRVVTADKSVATIEQGLELPYQVATSSGATSIVFRKANLRLEVIPQITPDGNVVIDVDVNKDSVGAETRAGFAIDTKHVKTQVMVENGGTVVLGGIYQQTERNSVSKVPLLGDVPVLGHLFKTTSRTSEKTELLVFITPKIVADKLSSSR